MSILIMGMDMPTDHPLWIVVHSDGTVEANEISQSRPVGWQTLLNAAVPVPPHGDLIERDKFRETMFIGEQCLYSWDEIEDAIDYAPTIIPAELPKEEA